MTNGRKLALILLLFSVIVFSQDYRYTETLFSNTQKVENIVYGNAPFINTLFNFNEASTTDGDLIMDIYYPDGDTETNRPAIVFVHSGAFINGHRNHEDMVKFCQDFAKKGYVTATIDYRKTFFLADQSVALHGTRAVYRGLQDGRAAIRFLRANAATYGIDDSKIYMGGSSAGGFVALHAAYMDEPSEKPSDAGAVNYWSGIIPYSAPDLGPYDIGANLGHNGKPDAIISLWGAIQSTDLITSLESTPAFIAHGTTDATVPYDSGSPFGYPLLPTVYGSKPINDKFDALGFTNKDTYFVTNEGHEFYGTSNGDWATVPNSHWNIIFDKSVNFLWNQHKPSVNFTEISNGLSIDFTDSSTGALSWLWDFGDGNTSTLQNPTHIYASSGNYDVKLYIENDIKSWNEITKSLTFNALSINELNDLTFNVYPNPTNGVLNITSKHPIDSIKIYSVLGREVLTTTTEVDKIDISNLTNGMYIIKVSSNNTTAVKRIIKN